MMVGAKQVCGTWAIELMGMDMDSMSLQVSFSQHQLDKAFEGCEVYLLHEYMYIFEEDMKLVVGCIYRASVDATLGSHGDYVNWMSSFIIKGVSMIV